MPERLLRLITRHYSMKHVDPDIYNKLQAARHARQQAGLWRQLRVPGDQINLCSNDYLGLSHHPKVIAAFTAGLNQYGCGSGGSALVCGYQRPHHQLSERLADWLGREAVLLCPSGYAANHAVVAALSELDSTYLFDKSCHASMYDAVQSHGATLQRFPHNQTDYLHRRLQQALQQSTDLRIIASEGIFSMDGDSADLNALLAAKSDSAENTWLWLDDAHALGVCGRGGRGIGGDASSDDVELLTATFGKAFGLGGALFAADRILIDAALQHTRHVIYSTAFSAAQAMAINAVIDVLDSEPQHRIQLEQRIAQFKQGLKELGWRSEDENQRLNHAIQPVICFDNQRAIELSSHLLKNGVLCSAIRPPTVAPGRAQLRFALSAAHSEAQITQVLDILGPAQRWFSSAGESTYAGA